MWITSAMAPCNPQVGGQNRLYGAVRRMPARIIRAPGDAQRAVTQVFLDFACHRTNIRTAYIFYQVPFMTVPQQAFLRDAMRRLNMTR